MLRRALFLSLLGLRCHSPPPVVVAPCAQPAVDTIRVAASDTAEAASLVRRTRCAGPAIAVMPDSGRDPRDVLDQGMDAVLTDDPRAIEYATARSDMTVLALPWSRTYVFVLKRGGYVTWAEPAMVWRNAVPADAEATMPPYWWRSCADSSAVSAPNVAPSPVRMVYRHGDANARGLAERFVARGASLEPPERRERVVAVGADELAAAVAAGTDYAVVALPKAGDCRAVAAVGLAARAPSEVIPMLDTRLHLIVRAGRFRVSLSGDGTPLFGP